MGEGDSFQFTQKQFFFIGAGLFLVGMIFFFAFVISDYHNKIVQVPNQLRAELISMRFGNIPECFAYEDPITKRVYPGVIDLAMFTNDTMFRCYHTEEREGFKDFNFGLHLKDHKKSLRTNNYFNKDDFAIFRKVLVHDGTDVNSDLLEVYVQVRIGEKRE